MGEKLGVSSGGDQVENHNEVVVSAPLRSPWKTSAAAPTPMAAADSDSWPALSDAKQRSKSGGVDFGTVKSNQKEATVTGGGVEVSLPVSDFFFCRFLCRFDLIV